MLGETDHDLTTLDLPRPVARDTPQAPGAALRAPAAPVVQAPRRRKRALRVSLAALLCAAAAGAGVLYWNNASRFVTTDDAFIAARQFSVAPKVAGYIASVPVTDNQHVAAGECDRADR